MFLAADIGNSRINFSLTDDKSIVKSMILDTDINKDSDFYMDKLTSAFSSYDITDCAIISVVKNVDKIIKKACDKAFGVNSVILEAKNTSEIKINSDAPQTVGMDRLANVYGVMDMLLPAIVVDIGTAVTFDILSKDKIFLGGVIMPGINMQLKALSNGTSKLPEIELEKSPYAIGNDTKTCILSGVIRGTAAAIDGLLGQCIEELGGCKTIVLTGGQAELISKYMKHPFNHIDKNLTLSGIKRMYALY